MRADVDKLKSDNEDEADKVGDKYAFVKKDT